MEKTRTIDVEPSWIAIMRLIARTGNASLVYELESACKLADLIRAEQKKGHSYITLKISDDGVTVVQFAGDSHDSD